MAFESVGGTFKYWRTFTKQRFSTDSLTSEAVEKNTYTTKYEHNQYGELTKQINSLGEATAYEYDEAGRLVKVTDPLKAATKYSYDKLGNKLSMTDGRYQKQTAMS
jgi:YD repeat-containing protein